jgi:uncharacterized membrane protein
MRARITLVLMTAAVALVAVPAASSYGGPDPNANAVENCLRNIDKQVANDVAAGGGTKAGVPAPTNCDHFFQQ